MMNNVHWFERPMHWRYVPRPFMPQVDEADQQALIEWLTFKGVEVTQVTVQPDRLQFAQHVDFNKVEAMSDDVYAKPIWVSRDGFVLDGNHRATAHKLRGDAVEALQVELDFEEAIGAIFSFAGTYDYAQRRSHAAL